MTNHGIVRTAIEVVAKIANATLNAHLMRPSHMQPDRKEQSAASTKTDANMLSRVPVHQHIARLDERSIAYNADPKEKSTGNGRLGSAVLHIETMRANNPKVIFANVNS